MGEPTGAPHAPRASRPLPASGRPRVAVVGGGIAGLAAAWELTACAGDQGHATEVVVLEASGRCGGKLRTGELAGGPVDLGPDGFLARRDEAAALCREVGLGDDLVPVGAAGAAVWARGRRRPLPEGLVLGVPTRLWPVARSGILSPLGTVRMAVDLLAPRPDRRQPLGDRAIGPMLARKLGKQATARLVEPLVGGIHAGAIADASAAALFPELLDAAQARTSVMRALRQRTGRGAAAGSVPPPGAGAPAPAFLTLRRGSASLSSALVAGLASRGASVETGRRVTALERTDGRWRLRTDDGSGGERSDEVADGVVLALPAPSAAALLAPHDADAAAALRTMEYASVAVVTLAFPAPLVPDDLYGTGLLVPAGTRLPRAAAEQLGLVPAGEETCMVTACTYLWQKWPHLARGETRLLRASVGRYGDDRFAQLSDEALVRRVVAELLALLDLGGPPEASLVTRWPDALPQYRVHHLLRVGGVEAAVQRLGGVALAGAAYHGVGIPACVASGRGAARAVLAQLGLLRQAATA